MPTNGDEPDVAYWHVEHTFVDAVRIGRAYERALAQDAAGSRSSAITLATCQRILYVGSTSDVATFPVPPLLQARAQIVQGATSAQTLLTEIAVGLRSRLLGERCILDQVARAVARSSHPAVQAIGRRAVSLAQGLRARHLFWARHDYHRIAFRLLDQTCARSPMMPPVLAVAGSGMLATSVLATSDTSWYDDVIVVTRSPARCARHLQVLGSSAIAMTADRATEALAATSFRFIAASGIATAEYRSALRRLSRLPTCLGIVDLSGDPLFASEREAGIPYVSMYDPRFERELSIANELMRDAAILVAADLRQSLANGIMETRATSIRHSDLAALTR